LGEYCEFQHSNGPVNPTKPAGKSRFYEIFYLKVAGKICREPGKHFTISREAPRHRKRQLAHLFVRLRTRFCSHRQFCRWRNGMSSVRERYGEAFGGGAHAFSPTCRIRSVGRSDYPAIAGRHCLSGARQSTPSISIETAPMSASASRQVRRWTATGTHSARRVPGSVSHPTRVTLPVFDRPCWAKPWAPRAPDSMWNDESVRFATMSKQARRDPLTFFNYLST
jgi:hypothetical protein